MTADLIIIGAGASGLMAAIAAGRQLKHTKRHIIIFERMGTPGKKILATGNGRCNYTNTKMDMTCFHSDTPDFYPQIIHNFDAEMIIDFFCTLGIVPKSRDGYMYPASGQASAILDVLLMEIELLPVEIVTQTAITNIRRTKKGFELTDQSGQHHYGQSVILAGGGCAYPKLGSDGSCYALAENVGHHIVTPVPALTGLYAKEKFFKSVSGVRAEGTIKIYDNGAAGTMLAEDRGELQFTDYGVSGIPAFQVSRFAARMLQQKHTVTASLDFCPDMSGNELFAELLARKETLAQRLAQTFFIGMFNQKLGRLFLNSAGIENDLPVRNLSKRQLGALADCMKHFVWTVKGIGDFNTAQVSAGGISCAELRPTMESKICPGLYIAGELADVDGICGGYNLSWAWASGYTAGICAGKELL